MVPQLPQLVRSASVCVSQPLRLVFSLALQSLYPALQLAMLHAPTLQAAVPLTELQAAAQPPQAAVLVLVFVSQPLAALPSQLP
jgi:hypothetical protein